MLTNLITRLFRDSDSSNEEDNDPGFTAFMETLHARRAAQEWYAPGPEGDLYRQRCRDEEMMRMESRNYGFIVKMDTTSSAASSASQSSIASSNEEVERRSSSSRPRSLSKRWKPSKLLRKYSSERPKRVSSMDS